MVYDIYSLISMLFVTKGWLFGSNHHGVWCLELYFVQVVFCFGTEIEKCVEDAYVWVERLTVGKDLRVWWTVWSLFWMLVCVSVAEIVCDVLWLYKVGGVFYCEANFQQTQ